MIGWWPTALKSLLVGHQSQRAPGCPPTPNGAQGGERGGPYSWRVRPTVSHNHTTRHEEPSMIYDDVATDLGWSPADMSPPFDLRALLVASYRDHAPSHRFRGHGVRLDPQWFQG